MILLTLLLAWSSGAPSELESTTASRGATKEAPPQALVLTLEDAFRLALDRNLDLALSAQTEEVARLTSIGTWGSFDPVFSLGANYGDGDIPQANSVITGGVSVLEAQTESASLALGVPLTSGGRLDLGLDSSFTQTNSMATAAEFSDTVVGIGYTQPLLRGAGVTAATAPQREARILWLRTRELQRETLESVLLDVANAYWNLVAAQELVQVRELSVQLGRTQVDQEKQRIEVGLGTEVDLIQAETQVSTETEQLLLAQNIVAVRADSLRALISRPGQSGTDGWEDFLSVWDLPIRTLTPLPEEFAGASTSDSWKTSLGRALEYRADLGRLRLDIDAAQIRHDLAKNSSLPILDISLGLQGNANQTSRTSALQDALGFDFPGWSAGLSFQRPLGNRTLRYAERAARAQLITARISYEQAENFVIALVRDAVRDLDYRSQAVRAARQSRQLAERQLDAEERRQQEGLSTTFQVLQFQRDLAQALSNEAQAKSAYAQAEAALLRAEGRLVSAMDLEPLATAGLRGDQPAEADDRWNWLIGDLKPAEGLRVSP